MGFAAILLWMRTSRILPDGIQYCLDARDGTNLLHPHHLIFIPSIRVVKALLDVLSVPADWIFAAQLHNALFVIPLLVGLYCWMRGATGDSRAATFATVAVASANSVMLFATQPESYLPALACGIVALAVAHSPRRSTTHDVIAAILLALAVLYHQLAVLLSVPVFVAAWRREMGSVRRASAILVGAGGVTLAAYVLAYCIDSSRESFVGYLTRYAHTSNEAWGTFRNVSLDGIESLGAGLLAAIVGARWTAVPGLLVVVSLLLLLAFWIAPSGRAEQSVGMRQVSLSWIAVYAPFLLWWFPAQDKYAIFWIVPVVVLIALALRGIGEFAWKWNAGIILVVAAIGVGNFVGRVVPDHEGVQPMRERAFALYELTKPGAVVIVDTETAAFLRYDHPEILSIPISVPMSAAFQNTLLDTLTKVSDPLARANSILVPFDLINPSRVIDGMCGNVYPPGWKRFIDWLLGVHTKSPGEFRMRQVESVSLRSGEVILRIGSNYDSVPGRRGVYDRLDSALANVPDPKFSFVRWFDSFRESG